LPSANGGKLKERELGFLTLEQIRELLQVIEGYSKNPHVLRHTCTSHFMMNALVLAGQKVDTFSQAES
jgi:hypothetical protein